MSTATLERPSQLEYATITVAYVNPPKPGQKSASIKDADGVYYWIKPADMANFATGASYDIGFAVSQSNGYTNRTIKSAEPVAAKVENYPSRQAERRDAAPRQPPQPQRTVPVQIDPRHNAMPANAVEYNRATHPRDCRRMFICSQMNALIQSRQIVPLTSQTIADAIAMLSEAYSLTLGQEDAAT